MNQLERIHLSSPHMSGREQKYVQEAFDTNWVAPLGKNVDEFERETAAYAGVKAAAAVSSGTAAIHLALKLIGVEEGDTVFCSSLTFVASANPVLYQKAKIVFIDSELDSWNMCPQALKKALQEADKGGCLPKALIVVNLYGQCAKMSEIMALCETYGVKVIEDAAESLGSIDDNRMSGSFGHFGVYSFNGNKIITTSGGGMLISNDEEAIEKARFYATQSRDPAAHYQHSQTGYNYRMSNVLAGIGRGQLEVLEERVARRREIYQAYEDAFRAIDFITMMPERPNTRHNRWLTTLTLPSGADVAVVEILKSLAEQNIEARHVWKPLHLQPLFSDRLFVSAQRENVSHAEQLFNHGLCLPSGSNLTEEELGRVIEAVLNVAVAKSM
ncbi:DegT/DnrJ/EryC1/StrS family aminotransferase [Aureibacillus halotolerans]|uniref:Pyridoxal phosphate-dependent aminotransferase EpsN n=1 Tax=Aureibacillus halotolerans TaxID=1508390 RepID=A0A4R6TV59_9BACI|nr:aminotransferase class I/II-fold pyridoxal phosphate-dependent enzyme [Aureibacillus halotolerans]TDQ37658.1 pyridoxal phosphate-dependent aminotransferase EpsN [Aureibacillus halotolerans]